MIRYRIEIARGAGGTVDSHTIIPHVTTEELVEFVEHFLENPHEVRFGWDALRESS